MKLRALIYTRISEDRDGTSTAPERQLADCTAYCAQQGLQVVGTFADRDLSASDPTVVRPGFVALLEAVKADQADAIVVWNGDRLVRQVGDLEDVLAACAPRGVKVHAVLGGETDGTDPVAVAMLRVRTVFGSLETEQLRARVMRKHQERAEAGLPHRTGQRPFGHSDDLSELVESEAEVIRLMVAAVLRGVPISRLVVDLAEAGELTTTGRPWRYATLRKLLVQARLAGARERDGRLIISGAIAPIISAAELEQVRQLLATNRRAGGSRSNTRRHLLSGLARCGACGHVLVAHPDKAKGLRYRCPRPSDPHSPGCGSLTVAAGPLEQLVADEVLGVLAEPSKLGERLAQVEGVDVQAAVSELASLDARLDDLAAAFADGELSRDQHRTQRARLLEQRDAVQASIRSSAELAVLGHLPIGAEARKAWEASDVAWRHDVVATLVDFVTVSKATRRGRGFDRSRVAIGWRH